MTEKFSHLVEIDEAQRKLRIDRVLPNGEKVLYTTIDIPSSERDGKAAFAKFAALLGENLLLDSPSARRLFKL